MINNEWPEYKKGDVVYIERIDSKGTIKAHKGFIYSIELFEPLTIKELKLEYTTYYFDPVTYVMNIDAHVGLLKLVKGGGEE